MIGSYPFMVIRCRPSDSDIGGGSIMEYYTIKFLDSPMRKRQSSIPYIERLLSSQGKEKAYES